MRLAALFFVFSLSVVGAFADAKDASRIINGNDAITIARAALVPVYGASTIADEEPLIAIRSGENWRVVGTLNCHLSFLEKLFSRGGCLGGTAEVVLSAKDGHILHITHSE